MITKSKKKFYILPDDLHIYVSGRIWHELYPRVSPSPFLYKRFEEIDLPSYGKGIGKFYFTFIATQPQNELHQPGRHYNAVNRTLEVAIRIPYEELVHASEHQTFRIMEAAFLEGITQIEQVALAESFDHQAFKADVEAIFADENWYVDAVPELD